VTNRSILLFALSAGAPLVALGIGTATASADIPAVTTPHAVGGVAVSVNGHEVGFGNSSASTTAGSHSIAVSINGSNASTTGSHDLAVAINGSNASAAGTHSTAIAINNSIATTAGGNKNKAIAKNGSTATAVTGDNNTAKALQRR
jgi:hypothetical protein